MFRTWGSQEENEPTVKTDGLYETNRQVGSRRTDSLKELANRKLCSRRTDTLYETNPQQLFIQTFRLHATLALPTFIAVSKLASLLLIALVSYVALPSSELASPPVDAAYGILQKVEVWKKKEKQRKRKG